MCPALQIVARARQLWWKDKLVEGQPRADCIMKSIYIVLFVIGLELWMTGYRLPGLYKISVADWLDN